MALVLLKSPGALGADIALGSAQRFGVPMGFGPPPPSSPPVKPMRSACPAASSASRDARGKTALRMTLQTREQHIRREKANSTSAPPRCCWPTWPAMYAVYHGPEGLRSHRRAHPPPGRDAGRRSSGRPGAGFGPSSTPCRSRPARAPPPSTPPPRPPAFNLRHVDGHALGVSIDEKTTRDDIAALLAAFWRPADIGRLDAAVAARGGNLPGALLRSDAILAHPVFNTHHTEHEMLRYLKRLQNRTWPSTTR